MSTFQAQATVATDKASRYLQALCGHFDRKVTATWNEHKGEVDFGFGHCQMQADASNLVIHIQSDTEENFARVKYVVGDHLERFAVKDSLTATWQEATSPQGVEP